MMPTAAPALGMILKGYPRISETFISNEILLLEQLGFRIHIFSMRHPREPFSHDSVKQIRARVDYLPQTLSGPLPRLLRHNLPLLVRSPEAYGHALKMAGRRFRRTRKAATIKHLLQAGYLVHACLPGTGVVHFHAHFAHSPASVALFAGMLSGLPYSFTAHAKDIYTSHRGQLREKIALARFVVTCTDYNRSYLSQVADGAKTPLYCIYHGIDTELFAAAEPRARADGEPYELLTVARIAPKKGLPTVYRAVRQLLDRGVPVRHTLIGDGEDRDRIMALIRELDLQENVRWLGTQPHEVVIEHYRRADVFMLGCEVAENGDRDGIPNVLMESMAMKVPVVATTVSAIPELVGHDAHGLLVPSRQPDKMADAVERLLTDPALRRRLTDNADGRVRRRFSNRALIQELADIYRRAVPAMAPPAPRP